MILIFYVYMKQKFVFDPNNMESNFPVYFFWPELYQRSPHPPEYIDSENKKPTMKNFPVDRSQRMKILKCTTILMPQKSQYRNIF